jgi:outer membrane protein assembly factor BamD
VRARAILTVLLIGFACCSKESIQQGLPADDIYDISMEAFNNRKYGKAIEGFKRLVFEHPGSELIDEAQFYLGESYFYSRDYENAVVEYKFLIQSFPESPYLDDATYKLALTYFKASPPYYLDQRRTNEALKIIERFIAHFPESELFDEAQDVREKCLSKLSRKEMENGKLYYKLGHYESAELYLLEVVESYPSSEYIEESRYMLALCYLKLGRNEEAKEIFVDLSENGGEYSERAKEELEKLDRKE